MSRYRIPAHLNGLWGPSAATPGPKGFNDHGDPFLCAPLGPTPGSLGMWDVSDFSLPIVEPGECCMFLGPVRTTDGKTLTLGAGKTAPGEAKGNDSSDALTLENLKALFPQAQEAYLKQIVDDLNADLEAYGLGTTLRQAHFFGQIMQEAGPRIQAKVEDLEYSPAALMKFDYYKLHPDEAKTDGYTKENGVKTKKADHKAIANKAYGRADLGNGGPTTGDGYKYRGRGMIQVTGKYNYGIVTKKYQELYEDDTIDFVNKPDLVMEFPYSLRSAVCFWLIHSLPALADRGKLPQDVDRITRVVNKNTDSYNARQKNFAAALEAFS